MSYSDQGFNQAIFGMGGVPLPILSTLLANMSKTVQDRFYKNQVINIDGYTFTNCCFQGCTLVTETGVFVLDGCTLLGCTVQFGDNAIRLVKLFNFLAGMTKYPFFYPVIASDGSITIK